MSIEQLQGRVAEVEAKLSKADGERAEIREQLEYAQRRLDEARTELQGLHDDIRAKSAGGPCAHVEASELLEATTTVVQLETALSDLQQEADSKLAALDGESERLRSELMRAKHERNKALFHDAVLRYQEAIQPAAAIADEIRKLSVICGIALPADHVPSPLLRRGISNIGGCVVRI